MVIPLLVLCVVGIFPSARYDVVVLCVVVVVVHPLDIDDIARRNNFCVVVVAPVASRIFLSSSSFLLSICLNSVCVCVVCIFCLSMCATKRHVRSFVSASASASVRLSRVSRERIDRPTDRPTDRPRVAFVRSRALARSRHRPSVRPSVRHVTSRHVTSHARALV